MNNKFSDLGADSQQMIIDQIQQIDLEKVSVSAKNLSVLGTALMKILRTANANQEKTKEEVTREKWIVIRQMTQSVLEEILEKVQVLSDAKEIPEWERPSIMGLLHDIAKACHDEEIRTNLADSENPQIEASDEFLDDMLNGADL
jgi:HD superfamily phosphohydrolase YqeK